MGNKTEKQNKTDKGPTGIRTQVARFKVWSANHYTMEPIRYFFSTQNLYTYIYKRLFEEAEGSRIGGPLFMEIQKLGSCKPVS